MAPPKILKIKLGPLYALNAVRDGDSFLLVLTERGAVNRRTQISLGKAEAMRLAQFLAGMSTIGDGPPPRRQLEEDDTDPGGADMLPLPTLPGVGPLPVPDDPDDKK